MKFTLGFVVIAVIGVMIIGLYFQSELLSFLKSALPNPPSPSSLSQSPQTSSTSSPLVPPPSPPLPPVENDIDYLLAYWGPNIDETGMDDTKWQKQVGHMSQLREVGFSYAGIRIARTSPDSYWRSKTTERINALRADGFNIALYTSAGHYHLAVGEADTSKKTVLQLDPRTHGSNAQNLKYFDASEAFDAFICSSGCGDCSQVPVRHAIDPAYTGIIWQKEIEALKSQIDQAAIGASDNDLVIFDTEVWGIKPGWVTYCYPDAFISGASQFYSGDKAERYQQYLAYWKDRGVDFRNVVKNKNNKVGVIFYGANIAPFASHSDVSDSWNNFNTWMPYGVSDSPSPEFYFAPNLKKFTEELHKGNFSDTVPWISFSTTGYGWIRAFDNQPESGWVTKSWDPKITQKIGYLLYQTKIKGVLVYPGPGDHGIPFSYYLAHARALVKGLKGNDVVLKEICGDDWDNDGDGVWDNEC